MINNSLKTILRHLWRNRLFTVLNILGLAIGISACWIIYRIVDYELSFDKQHPDVEQIYQIVSRHKYQGKESGSVGVPLPLAPALTQDITGPELVVPIYRQHVEKLTIPAQENPEQIVEEPRFVATLPAYFDMVPYQWLAGSMQTALDAPDKVVLTESRAAEYFPGLEPESILGKTLVYDTVARTITGIVADLRFPSSFGEQEFVAVSHNDWASDVWGMTNTANNAFVKIEPGTSIGPVLDFINQKKLDYLGEAPPNLESWFEALPLTEKHFATEYSSGTRTASMSVLYGLSGIGFFLLILACINYNNLSAAQVPQRAREIGIRKVLGASVAGIVQLLSKDFVKLVLFALVIASPIAWWAMNRWLQDFAYRIEIQWWMFAAAGIAAVSIALLTISFQAIKAAVANPVESLRDE